MIPTQVNTIRFVQFENRIVNRFHKYSTSFPQRMKIQEKDEENITGLGKERKQMIQEIQGGNVEDAMYDRT